MSPQLPACHPAGGSHAAEAVQGALQWVPRPGNLDLPEADCPGRAAAQPPGQPRHRGPTLEGPGLPRAHDEVRSCSCAVTCVQTWEVLREAASLGYTTGNTMLVEGSCINALCREGVQRAPAEVDVPILISSCALSSTQCVGSSISAQPSEGCVVDVPRVMSSCVAQPGSCACRGRC